jgi:hypothetical protein
MSGLATIAELRILIEALPVLGPAGERHAAVLERWFAGEDFEVAAGLQPGWRAVERRSRRDALICELARHYPGSRYARAETIGAELRRYQATAWRCCAAGDSAAAPAPAAPDPDNRPDYSDQHSQAFRHSSGLQ